MRSDCRRYLCTGYCPSYVLVSLIRVDLWRFRQPLTKPCDQAHQKKHSADSANELVSSLILNVHPMLEQGVPLKSKQAPAYRRGRSVSILISRCGSNRQQMFQTPHVRNDSSLDRRSGLDGHREKGDILLYGWLPVVNSSHGKKRASFARWVYLPRLKPWEWPRRDFQAEGFNGCV